MTQVKPFGIDEVIERITSVIEATVDFQGEIDELAAKVDSLRTRLTEEDLKSGGKFFYLLLADCAATLRMASMGMDAIHSEERLIRQLKQD